MVMLCADCSRLPVLADSPVPMGLERLDPETRTVVIMALLGLVLLGVTLVACVMIGGRWVRRLARQSPHSVTPRTRVARAANSKAATGNAPGPTGDTLTGEQRTDETRTD